MGYIDITPTALSRRLAESPAPRLIDVRERWEWDVAHLTGAELMPISEMRDWMQRLAPEDEVVFYCHTGRRSAMVCQYLASALGFRRLANLDGGIDAWSQTVDPTLRRY